MEVLHIYQTLPKTKDKSLVFPLSAYSRRASGTSSNGQTFLVFVIVFVVFDVLIEVCINEM